MNDVEKMLELYIECEPQHMIVISPLILVLIDVLQKDGKILCAGYAYACIISRPGKLRHIVRLHRHKRTEWSLRNLIPDLRLGPEQEAPAVVRLLPGYLEPLSQRQVKAMSLV